MCASLWQTSLTAQGRTKTSGLLKWGPSQHQNCSLEHVQLCSMFLSSRHPLFPVCLAGYTLLCTPTTQKLLQHHARTQRCALC